MTNEERYALLRNLQEAEHRMKLAKERGNGHAYKDAKKWRDKIKIKFDIERKKEARAFAIAISK